MLILYHNSYGNSKSSGGISRLGGGDFWSGAAAGFIGSGTGSLLHNAKPHWQIAGSALSGGLGAELGGGDFWQGAAFGGIVAGANHLKERQQIKKLINLRSSKSGQQLAQEIRKYYQLRRQDPSTAIKYLEELIDINTSLSGKNPLGGSMASNTVGIRKIRVSDDGNFHDIKIQIIKANDLKGNYKIKNSDNSLRNVRHRLGYTLRRGGPVYSSTLILNGSGNGFIEFTVINNIQFSKQLHNFLTGK